MSDDADTLDRLWRDNQRKWREQRDPDAKARGGWIYVLRDPTITPGDLAAHYSGGVDGALAQLLDANPDRKIGTAEQRWFSGMGLRLPYAWGDPWLRPALTRPVKVLRIGDLILGRAR